MKFCIIIPAYNCENTIEKALFSIYNNLNPGIIISTIIVNDNSSDNTCLIIRNHIKKYKHNIHLLENDKNLGAGRSRNVALEYIYKESNTYDYVFFLDSDDYYTAGFINFFANHIKNLPIEPDLVFFKFNYLKVDNYPYTPRFCPNFKSCYTNLLTNNLFYSFGPCYRAYNFKFLMSNRPLFGLCSNNDDVNFSITCILLSKCNYFLNKVGPIISRNINPLSLSKNLSSSEFSYKFKLLKSSMNEIKDTLTKYNIYNDELFTLIQLYLIKLFLSRKQIKYRCKEISSVLNDTKNSVLYVSMYHDPSIPDIYRCIKKPKPINKLISFILKIIH